MRDQHGAFSWKPIVKIVGSDVTVPVDQALLRQAKALGIDLSRVLDDALRLAVGKTRRARWLKDNREALDAYNRHVERDGVFSERC